MSGTVRWRGSSDRGGAASQHVHGITPTAFNMPLYAVAGSPAGDRFATGGLAKLIRIRTPAFQDRVFVFHEEWRKTRFGRFERQGLPEDRGQVALRIAGVLPAFPGRC